MDGQFTLEDSLQLLAKNYHKIFLAELIKMRNELRKEELMNAVINSDKSYEEILAFVKGEVTE